MDIINREAYKKVLGLMESGGNYKQVNELGALGKYQFMPNTLNSLKNLFSLEDWQNKDYFLNHPDLQETYEDYLITDSINYINNAGLTSHLGKSVTGSKRFLEITTNLNIYGLLAGIHLAGTTAVSRYFVDGYNPNDGLTSLTDYMAYFSDSLKNESNNKIMFAGFALILFITYLLHKES